MPFLYKSHCYETLSQVVSSIQSTPMLGDGYILTNAVASLNDVLITAQKELITANYTFTPPICSKLGFDNSYSGLTTVDSLELWALGSVAMAAAYASKLLRRGF